MLEKMKSVHTEQKPSRSPNEFGRRLRAERVASGLSLAALADRLKVTKGYISRLESGKATPSAHMVERIAKAIGVDSGPLYILAGYLPTDVKQILYRHPIEAPAILRETFGEFDRREHSGQQFDK